MMTLVQLEATNGFGIITDPSIVVVSDIFTTSSVTKAFSTTSVTSVFGITSYTEVKEAIALENP